MNADASLTDRAYNDLRIELISCRLPPGERLNISAIQNRLSLSQAAVREALSRLTSEGLVEVERHRGFRASPVSTHGFKDLMQALLTVEIPCLHSAIANGDREWELNLVATYHRALHTVELVVEGKEPIDAYASERLSFYEALFSASDNPWLRWCWRLLYAQNMRYRHLYMPLARYELDLSPQFECIMEAVLARDANKVVAQSIEHYAMVTEFIELEIAKKASEDEAEGIAGRRKKAGSRRQPA